MRGCMQREEGPWALICTIGEERGGRRGSGRGVGREGVRVRGALA
jgi:hypothetical protein